MPLQPQKQEVDVPALIEEFDRKLERLKILYEQYFIGIEKREPLVPLKDVVRVMHVLDQEQIKNTGHRYRFRMLVQKLNSYKTYWSRTVRAIEAGTYFRDVARVQRSFARKGISVARTGRAATAADVERAFADAAKEAAAREEGRPRHDTEEVAPVAGKKAARRRDQPEEPELAPINLDAEPPTEYDEDEQTNPGIRAHGAAAAPDAAAPTPPATTPRPVVRKTVAELPKLPDDLPAAPKLDLPELPAAPADAARRPAAQARPRPAAPAARAGGGPSEAELQSLYRRFVKAKEMCGEDTSTVRYETLVKSIRSQLPKIAAEHGGRPVEFQVVIRNNRAILRAKPKE